MRRILVVDDDPGIVQLLKDLLDLEGYAVDTANNGAVALVQVERRRPDLVLLDLMMPVMDGWQFLRACREQRDLADLPVVVLSAAKSAPTDEPAVRGFVGKPFELPDLLSVVEQAVATN
jgi:CheY-like chemotaxis protein